MPQVLPGGKAVLFSLKPVVASWESGQVVVQTIGGDRKTLVVGGASGRDLPTGHLVYMLSGVVLLAVPFDLASLWVAGGPAPVVEGVRRHRPRAGPQAERISASPRMAPWCTCPACGVVVGRCGLRWSIARACYSP